MKGILGIIEKIRGMLGISMCVCVCVWKVGLSCSNGVDEQQKMWIGFCVSTIAHLQKVQVCSVSHCVYPTHKISFAMFDSSPIYLIVWYQN